MPHQHYRLSLVLHKLLGDGDLCSLRSHDLQPRRKRRLQSYSFFAAYIHLHVELQNSAYLQQVAANYGDLRFMPITVDAAFTDRHFQIANTFMLTGNYKHFITASPNKQVQSVATFTLGNLKQFKILYSGSGGGLMLCLVSVDITTNLPILSSFVSIGTTDIVDNCDQYSLNTKC